MAMDKLLGTIEWQAIMSTASRVTSHPLFKFWPILMVIFFCMVMYLTVPKAKELIAAEQSRNNATQMLNEEHACLAIVAAFANLPEDDRQRLSAREALAAVYLAEHHFDSAQKIYEDVFKIRQRHNQDLTDTGLSLAELYCDMGDFGRAETYYKLVWNYDKAHLDKNDPRIIRDLNNMGATYFLIGKATEDKLERELELNRANFFLIQAELASRGRSNQSISQDQANIWENRALALRELGSVKEADILKNRAKKVHQGVPNRIDPP
jgi:tetratricopeptide (TPR) repeat protein